MRKPAAVTSVSIHVIALLLLFALTFPQLNPVGPPLAVVLARKLPPLRLSIKTGGGGANSRLPVSRGQTPPKALRLFVPPTPVVNDHPALVLTPALFEIPETNLSPGNIGDPLGRLGLPSGGPGFKGIGTGGPGGKGDGDRPGIGGNAQPPKLSSRPEVIHMEEPEYSEAARKAHFEGTVTLAIEVDATGRPVNIRVIRSLGMGLDEKAMEAVSRWKFRPGISNGRPVAAPATVEVNFRLL